jgi:peptide/nickel transport system permease protein
VRYLARRLGHALVVLLGVSMLSFVFAELAPGDVFDELRLDPRISATTVAAMRGRYGADGSVPQKYLQWLQSVGRGEMGFSVTYNGPVGPLLWPRVRNTLLLTIPATALAWSIAIPLGVWGAARRGGWVDRAGSAAGTAILSVPDVLLGLGFLLIAVRTGYFPPGGMVSLGFPELSTWGKVKDAAWHSVVPVAALTLAAVPVLVRHVRASVAEVLHAPFIDAARALGIPERRLLVRDALRAAANPLVSLLGLSIGALLSSSLVIETILSWPGLGPLLLEAVSARDLHVVVGAVVCSTGLLLGGTLVADALLVVADPRVRPEQP